MSTPQIRREVLAAIRADQAELDAALKRFELQARQQVKSLRPRPGRRVSKAPLAWLGLAFAVGAWAGLRA